MEKILCLIDGLGPGGAQRQLVGLANLLQLKGYGVLFVWYHPKDFYRQYLEEHNISYIQLKASNKLAKIFILRKAIKEYNPDVVISYLNGPSKIASILKMLGMDAKLIVSERAVLQNLSVSHRIKFHLYKWADYVVSNAQTQTNLIDDNFKNLRSKTVTIRNFVDTDYFAPSKSKEEPGDRSIRMLVVGRISKQKNILRFMQAVKEVLKNGIKLEVRWFGNVSVGQQVFANEVKATYETYKFDGAFEFYPATNNILKEYQACDAFCLPSLYEGFPNVVCEAMSCGKPVLCSDVDDNSFVVHHKENGLLFDPTSVDDMACKIRDFCLLSQNERIEMGRRSREIALKNFSGEEFVKKYIKLIES